MAIEDDLKDVEPAVREIMLKVHNARLHDVPRLPEPLFRSHILPILIDTSGKADMGNWIAVAGSLNRAIDVVGPDGEVMFRAPPLQGTVRTRTTRTQRHPLHAIVDRWDKHKVKSPIAAEKYMRAALAASVPEPLPPDLTPVAMLNVIFRHYGLEEIKIGGKAIGAENPAEQETPSDEGNVHFTDGFDDF